MLNLLTQASPIVQPAVLDIDTEPGDTYCSVYGPHKLQVSYRPVPGSHVR